MTGILKRRESDRHEQRETMWNHREKMVVSKPRRGASEEINLDLRLLFSRRERENFYCVSPLGWGTSLWQI